MSRIGRLPISVPAGVEVKVDGNLVTVKGSKGELSHQVASPITVALNDNEIAVSRPNDERVSRSLHGLTRTLIQNMIIGVTNGYEKKLEIVGTGYRVTAKGNDLEFALGYSHPISVSAPEGVSFAVEGANKLTISGIDKQLVGQVAANIRGLRKPDPYKGKGVRYAGEHIRRKVGKAGHMFVQVIDDVKGVTLASASTMEAELRAATDLDKTAKAKRVGELIAERAKAAGIETVVFDRGGNKYHGRVAAVADGAREGGLAL